MLYTEGKLRAGVCFLRRVAPCLQFKKKPFSPHFLLPTGRGLKRYHLSRITPLCLIYIFLSDNATFLSRYR